MEKSSPKEIIAKSLGIVSCILGGLSLFYVAAFLVLGISRIAFSYELPPPGDLSTYILSFMYPGLYLSFLAAVIAIILGLMSRFLFGYSAEDALKGRQRFIAAKIGMISGFVYISSIIIAVFLGYGFIA